MLRLRTITIREECLAHTSIIIKAMQETISEEFSGQGEFITRGDANEKEDIAPVPYGSLIGVVTSHFPVLGK